MKRKYTLFMATEELLTCPEIYQHAQEHNIILAPNDTRTLSIVTPLEQPLGDIEGAHMDYDPHMVDVSMVHIMHEQSLLFITLTLRSLDVGVTELVLQLPEATGSPIQTTSTITD